MKRELVFLVAAVLVCEIATAAHIAGTRMVRHISPMETPTEPQGENVLSKADGSEICCSLLEEDHDLLGEDHSGGASTCDGANNSGAGYMAGDSVTLNSYWSQNVDAGPYTVVFNSGVRIPNGNIVILLEREPIDFGNIDAAGTYKFCVASILVLPPQCDDGDTLQQGHGVEALGTGLLNPGESDSLHTSDEFHCNWVPLVRPHNRPAGANPTPS